MKKIINLLSVFALVATTSCGQQNKVAEGAVDSETVLVNRVQELEGQNGEAEAFGEVGVVHGAKSIDELNEMVENGEVTFMSENELEAAGIVLEETETPVVQDVVFWPAVLFLGFIVGHIVGESTASTNYNVYYNSHRVERRGHHSYNRPSTYYRPQHQNYGKKVNYSTTYWY